MDVFHDLRIKISRDFRRILTDAADGALATRAPVPVQITGVPAERLCERVAIMAGGRVIASGTPESLCSELEGTVWTRTVPRSEGQARGRVAPLLERPSPSGTVQVVLADSPPDATFERKAPDLEDAFHSAVRRAVHGAAA